MKIQVQFNEINFQFNENSSSLQWQFKIQFLKTSGIEHPGIRFQKLLPPFLTDKMEEHFRSLADSLGECSRLVSQVLASTSSSSNTKVPDSVTQVVSENNLSSRSNVSSAVERARSMLQRSRSTGLCSRLSQRERLRSASPSVPSSNRGKKQKTTPEQCKPFEFALMYVGDADDDEEENLSINHDNILLRGFVNLVNTDGEADIRSKIGDAIRLKYPLVGNRDFVFLRANRRKLSTPVSCEEYTYKQVKLLCGQGAIYIKMKSGLNCLTCEDDGTSLIEDDDLPGKFCCVFKIVRKSLHVKTSLKLGIIRAIYCNLLSLASL